MLMVRLLTPTTRLKSGLVPTEDAVVIEGADSPYANIVTVTPEHLNDEKIQTLIKVLQSDDVKSFIQEQYKGAVVPAF